MRTEAEIREATRRIRRELEWLEQTKLPDQQCPMLFTAGLIDSSLQCTRFAGHINEHRAEVNGTLITWEQIP